jgi:hypothetical protein
MVKIQIDVYKEDERNTVRRVLQYFQISNFSVLDNFGEFETGPESSGNHRLQSFCSR